MGGNAVDVLHRVVSQQWERQEKRFGTNHSEGPKETVVDAQPGLFAKPGEILPLLNSVCFREGRKQVLHSCSAKAGEQYDAEQDEVAIVPTNAILARLWVVVGECKVFGGVFAGARHAMGKE